MDDNIDHGATLVDLLQISGHEARFARNAFQALDTVEHWVPEIILLDIGLPKLDGYQALPRLRERAPHARVYAVTGYGMTHDRERALKAGFDEHLVKPVDITVIEQLIESAG